MPRPSKAAYLMYRMTEVDGENIRTTNFAYKVDGVTADIEHEGVMYEVFIKPKSRTT